MAADDVVGEDLELGLGVGFRGFRQEERVRHHLAVGLLGVRAHDDLALEHRARLAIERGLEQLAARAADGRVVDHERRIEMALAARETRAEQFGGRLVAREIEIDLLARGGRAGRERHSLEPRLFADAGREGRKVQRAEALVLQLDDLGGRLVGDVEAYQRVGLVVSCIAHMALDQRDRGALADRNQHPPVGRMRGARLDVCDMDGTGDFGAVRDDDNEPVGHKRRVERDHRVVCRNAL